MQIKLAYIISQIDKALAFEWIAEELPNESLDLCFILLHERETALEQFLKQKNIRVFRINYRGKKDFFSTFLKIFRILGKEKIQVVHCHLFDASLIGLLAAKMAGVQKRISTRHHSTLHHVYFPRAVYYDRFINFLATDLVAISENVRKILVDKEKVKAQKVHLVHHGFRLQAFAEVSQARIQKLRDKYQLTENHTVIGVIARQTEWKGIQYIVPAFIRLQKKYPQAILLLANAKGEYKAKIEALLQEMAPANYRQILFEEDIFALYQLFNIHVHTPIDDHSEAFGQTYVEALAAGIPSVFTLSGVAAEFIQDGENALTVDFKNSEVIWEAMNKLLENPALRNHLKKQGQEHVKRYFDLPVMITKLRKLYQGKTI